MHEIFNEYNHILQRYSHKIRYYGTSPKLLHKEDGPAVHSVDGSVEEWWFNGVLHRLDGPALMHKNESPLEEWRIRGKLHRWDGPASIYPGGEEWWVDGKRVDFLPELLENCQITGPFTSWTDSEWMLIRLGISEDINS